MAVLITGTSLTDVWRGGVAALLAAPRAEIYDLLLEVSDPTSVDEDVASAVDGYLRRVGLQRLDKVANTIFPARFAERTQDRQKVYDRYERVLPRLRRLDARNRRGTYFSRIIRYPLQLDPARANQLERVIGDLRMNPERRMRHIYEIQIFAPGKDLRPEGFPCMSSLSLHIELGFLRLAATYRNEYLVERGLGNLLGLARLQQYIGRHADLAPGALSLHAFHAQLDRPRRDMRALLDGFGDMGQEAAHIEPVRGRTR